MVVVVHKDNPVATITLAELKDLFTGTTLVWPDGRPVVLYNRNSDSGTREIFQDKVLGKGIAFSSSAVIKRDGVLMAAVAKIPASIAYDGFGHADPKQVKLVAIDGVMPLEASIQSGSYALTRTPTLATKGDPTGDAKAFIEFTLGSEGQAIVKQNGLLLVK